MALAIWGAFDFTAAAIVMAALTLVMPIIWWKFRMVIIVDEELRVDRAHIELKYLKEAKPVSAEQYKKLRSINSDARSFHITRPWLKTGVQVLVNDDRDPTSYWLIGCKNIEGLARALK